MLMSERKEAILRIIIGLVTGLILEVWGIVVMAVVVLHWFYALLLNKRSEYLAEFANKWVTVTYQWARYIGFTTNRRPFPFSEFGKDIEKVNMK